MILSFSTQLNGKGTLFPEKIWGGLLLDKSLGSKSADLNFSMHRTTENWELIKPNIEKPKLHTIRKDKNDRWQPGTMIDFYINSRRKDMFRFAPRIPVVSTQEIEINWYCEKRDLEPSKLAHKHYNYVEVVVGSNVLDIKEIEKLAVNDGFENVADFFAYFNEDFKGKIIHWTDLKY